MRKTSKIFLVSLIILSLSMTLAACDSSNDIDDVDEDVSYNDGSYVGQGEKREFGYEEAEVTIENGEIVNIVLKRMEADGEEVDYDEWTGEDGKPDLKQFRLDMAEEMLEKQAYNVDAISTATETSEGWKDAVKEALEEAK